jgi:hypothetical protein
MMNSPTSTIAASLALNSTHSLDLAKTNHSPSLRSPWIMNKNTLKYLISTTFIVSHLSGLAHQKNLIPCFQGLLEGLYWSMTGNLGIVLVRSCCSVGITVMQNALVWVGASSERGEHSM